MKKLILFLTLLMTTTAYSQKTAEASNKEPKFWGG